jgi:hypothetical protein
MTRSNTYSYYQTNHPNILGGYMTYRSFEQARQAREGGWGTAIYICTMVRHDNNIGINTDGPHDAIDGHSDQFAAI